MNQIQIVLREEMSLIHRSAVSFSSNNILDYDETDDPLATEEETRGSTKKRLREKNIYVK